ncbi:MAG: hypothetical protein M1834_008038 [Cirrosporium novae-zelandiae]|nr:MAG: hypothetical protein M1834_008038 [Cirrosporium novae-zelandiae]
MLLPIPILWKLQASIRRRLALLGIITCGGVGVIVSIVRVIVLYDFAMSDNFVPLIQKTVIMTSVEISAYILSANLPSMKAIWSKHVTKSLPSAHGFSTSAEGTSGRNRNRSHQPNQVSIMASGHSHDRSNRSRSQHELAVLTSKQDRDWDRDRMRSDSEEELFNASSSGDGHSSQQEGIGSHTNGIVVTRELGINSETVSVPSGLPSPDFNQHYYEFPPGKPAKVPGKSRVVRKGSKGSD